MLTRESLIEWATSWVPDNPPGQKKRFAEALAMELLGWSVNDHGQRDSIGCCSRCGALDGQPCTDV